MKLKEAEAYISSALISAEAARIVLAETGAGLRLSDALSSAHSTALAIGPEGGWTDDELAVFDGSGWRPASLGDTILRAETAAIVATALALDAMQ